jgi:sulfotransferase
VKKIVFNCSFPRAGSTLLQNILAQNPRFYCTPTSGVFELLYTSRDVFSKRPEFLAQDFETMRQAFLGYCSGGLQGYFSSVTDRPVCVDKARAWLGEYDWLAEFSPNPKVIVLIRDLRAILSSMEKRWRKFPHLHRAELSTDPAGIKMATLENRVNYWLNSLPVGSSITKLVGALQRGQTAKFHIMRFEDLTVQPQKIMEDLYDYLEEPRFDHDFSNVLQVTQEDDSFYPIYGDHKIRNEVRPVPLDYREVLGKGLSETIKQHNPMFFSAFYPGR